MPGGSWVEVVVEIVSSLNVVEDTFPRLPHDPVILISLTESLPLWNPAERTILSNAN